MIIRLMRCFANSLLDAHLLSYLQYHTRSPSLQIPFLERGSQHWPWVLWELQRSIVLPSLEPGQAELLHQSTFSIIYHAFVALDSCKILASLIGWPKDISLPKTASIPLTFLNSRLRLVASGITRTTRSIRLIFPRPIHVSLWTNQSGTLPQIKMALQTVTDMQHLCHQCMSVWRPIFLTVS